MKVITLFLAFFLPILSIAQQTEIDALVHPKNSKSILTVGLENADIIGNTNSSIQYAIEAVAATGGTVKLKDGTFEINSPIKLKSNVKLIGSGPQTILKKSSGIQTKFIVDADYGELKLTVENSDGFVIGMKIQVTDEMKNSCWDVSTAYITDIEDNVLYIDDYLIRDYRSDKNGLVSDASSVVEIIEAENAVVSDLTVDGSRSTNFKGDGCNSAGIYIFKSKNITVDNVHVMDFNGEGISWQITENVSILNSEINGSGNTGLHPGSGSPFSIIENNKVHHNDVDGLFICWRVYQSKVANNKFYENGRYGICTGHKDTDVVFLNNEVANNGNDGIHLRGERKANAPHRNQFIANTIKDNGTKSGGYGFSVNSPAEELILKDNIFSNSMSQFQKAAIYIHANGITPIMEDNKIGKHPDGEIVYEKVDTK